MKNNFFYQLIIDKLNNEFNIEMEDYEFYMDKYKISDDPLV